MKILFIGGNGNISWWCVQRALERGYEVWELNRALTRKTRRPVQNEVQQIVCDARNMIEMKEVLKGKYFDVVCDFISYNGEQARQMVDLFLNKTNQYIAISSEAVYKRQQGAMPFHENSAKYEMDEVNGYIKGKLEMEEVYLAACDKKGFPMTLVRPGYTYDLIIHTPAGKNCFTTIKKLKEGKPMIMYGDGENLFSPLHSSDFSRYFIELCGNKSAIGECYNIAGQEYLSYNKMEQYVMEAFNVEENGMIHIPVQDIKTNELFEYDELVKQHMMDHLFDTQKINSLVKITQNIPFEKGIKETAGLLMRNNAFRRIDKNLEEKLDKIYELYN